MFGDSFEDFTQKSEKVDMWTSVCLIILKATTVHQPRGGPGPKQTSWPLTSDCPPAHWGEPFHCPRQGVPYTTWGFGLPPKKKDEGGRGARVAGDQKPKRRSSKREVDGGGILEEAFPARWNL